MAVIIKALGAQTITVSGTANLYVVPAGKSAAINNVRLVNGNNGGATQALKLQVKPSGSGTTARLIHKMNFTIAANGSFVMQDSVTLGEGDALQLDIASGAGSNVAYLVSGVERE